MAQYNIKNLEQTMKLLKGYEPDLSKEINKRITRAATTVLKEARGDIAGGAALSNWGPWIEGKSGRDISFDGATAQRNIKLTRAAMRRRGRIVSNFIGIVAKDAATVIYHTAGQAKTTRYRATSNRGLTMRSNMNKTFGEKRGIWKAFDANQGAAQREIYAAAKDAEKAVQAALNRLGG